MDKILDGKKLATELNNRLKKRISDLIQETNIPPTLATILVGKDPASKVYVKIKHQTCEKVGINSVMVSLPESASKSQISEEIEKLNRDVSVHAILLQLPLPEKSRKFTEFLLQKIDIYKDVDGFHYLNRGKLFYKTEQLVPCTPKGIITLLDHNGINVQGKDITIINHSNLLGKPLMVMLVNRDATVSVCHVHTKNIEKFTRNADILVVGVGKAQFITKDKIKSGAVIIDVGINRIEGRLYGDVDFEDVYDKCGSITPVPGGVGPMTVASLLQNTIIAYKTQLGLD